eukprot:3308445-Prymnesium_polylepis.1
MPLDRIPPHDPPAPEAADRPYPLAPHPPTGTAPRAPALEGVREARRLHSSPTDATTCRTPAPQSRGSGAVLLLGWFRAECDVHRRATELREHGQHLHAVRLVLRLLLGRRGVLDPVDHQDSVLSRAALLPPPVDVLGEAVQARGRECQVVRRLDQLALERPRHGREVDLLPLQERDRPHDGGEHEAGKP